MSKQKNTEDRKESQSKNERAVFDKNVRAQPGDIYKVVTNGVVIEFTNRLSEAQTAFKEANKPKQFYKLSEEGGVVCLGNVFA